MLAGEWPDQQHGTRGMIQNKTCDMPDRFWTDRRFSIVFGAGVDYYQVSLPLSRGVDDFTLGPALAFQGFRPGKVLEPLVENLACSAGLGLPHFLLT